MFHFKFTVDSVLFEGFGSAIPTKVRTFPDESFFQHVLYNAPKKRPRNDAHQHQDTKSLESPDQPSAKRIARGADATTSAASREHSPPAAIEPTSSPPSATSSTNALNAFCLSLAVQLENEYILPPAVSSYIRATSANVDTSSTPEDKLPTDTAGYVLTADMARLCSDIASGAAIPIDDPLGYAVTKLLAIDCEMCETDAGLELTRITVVDESQAVVYESLVKPVNPIRNYWTQYSGITAKMLKDITVRLEDVQAALLQLITPGTALIGHSLENDLRALKLHHCLVMDTALLFPHPAGPPRKYALRVLAKTYLNKTIQVS